MDEDHLDADEAEQDQVLHDLLLQFFVDHGVAAVFDHDDFAVVPIDVRKGLYQDLGPIRAGNVIFHGMPPPVRSGNRR